MAEVTLAALRSLMVSHSPPLDALVVPSEDYHQVSLTKSSEFVIKFSVCYSHAYNWLDMKYDRLDVWCQSEYVSARDKRREFVSGFTGSAGLFLSLSYNVRYAILRDCPIEF